MARKKNDGEKPSAKKTTKQRLQFRFEDNGQRDSVSPEALTKAMRSDLGGEPMGKSVEPQPYRENLDPKFDRNKLSFSAHQYTASNHEEKTWDRISDQELKKLAQIDPYISAIISKRASQCAVIGRVSESKFDKGTRIKDLNPPQKEKYKSDEEYKKAVAIREEQMQSILNWVMTCGYNDTSLLNTVFEGSDQLYKRCTFAEFVVAQARNLLTFGRCGTHVMRNSEGLPAIFRPAPIETIYPIKNIKDPIPVMASDETRPQSVKDAKDWNKLDPKERPYAYVQRIDGFDANFFTEEDMKIGFFQKQAYFDLNGYPLSPIELAIYMVFIHQQALGYLKNQFVKGITTKSLLTIEASDPSVHISDEDLDQLRREFHNYVLRTDNSAVTPVLAGPFKVNVVPLSPSSKDMEFLQLEDHIIRALCSSMQITPQEMGYGYLGEGNGGLGNNNKQEEIVRGEETGLRMILDTIYDQVNEILDEAFKGFKENFRITYIGVGEDTRETVMARGLQELQTTATMNSLLADSDKTDIAPFGGDVPLSTVFHQNVVRYMKYGDFMEHYFKVEGASKKPEFDFLIDPNLNQAYQQLRVNPIEMQQAQSKMQMEQIQSQMQMQEAQMQQGMAQGQEQQAQQQDQAEPQQESLRDKFQGMQKSDDMPEEELQKSMEYYFESWIKAHENLD